MFVYPDELLLADAPGIGLVLSYLQHSDSSSVAWENNATDNGNHKVIAGNGVGLVLTDANYPMMIRTAVVTSSIRQSSPFPCDTNKVLSECERERERVCVIVFACMSVRK